MKKRGFTLIELLVVVFIIGILASVVLVATSSARSKSRDDKRKIDVDTIAQAAEMYYANKKTYPCPLCTNFSTSNWDTLLKPILSSYVSSWPDSTTDYVYMVNSSDPVGKKYLVDAELERKTSASVCNDNENEWVSGNCNDGDTTHYRRVSQ